MLKQRTFCSNTRVPYWRHVCRRPFSGFTATSTSPYSSLSDAFRFTERTISVVIRYTTTAWRTYTYGERERKRRLYAIHKAATVTPDTGSPVLFVCYRFLFLLLLINWNRRRQPWPGCAVRKTLNTRVHIPIERARAHVWLIPSNPGNYLADVRQDLRRSDRNIPPRSCPPGAWCFRIERSYHVIENVCRQGESFWSWLLSLAVRTVGGALRLLRRRTPGRGGGC